MVPSARQKVAYISRPLPVVKRNRDVSGPQLCRPVFQNLPDTLHILDRAGLSPIDATAVFIDPGSQHLTGQIGQSARHRDTPLDPQPAFAVTQPCHGLFAFFPRRRQTFTVINGVMPGVIPLKRSATRSAWYIPKFNEHAVHCRIFRMRAISRCRLLGTKFDRGASATAITKSMSR